MAGRLTDPQIVELGKQIYDIIDPYIRTDDGWTFCEEAHHVKMYKYEKRRAPFRPSSPSSSVQWRLLRHPPFILIETCPLCITNPLQCEAYPAQNRVLTKSVYVDFSWLQTCRRKEAWRSHVWQYHPRYDPITRHLAFSPLSYPVLN